MVSTIVSDPMASESPPKPNQAITVPKKQSIIDRLLKRPTLILITPYVLGLIWTALHPLVSIVTGELKCRGIYIDENGLDVHRHRVETYPIGRWNGEDRILAQDNLQTIALGMCDALKIWQVTGASIKCLRHSSTNQIEFDVVKISPSIGPVVQSPEAIVLVVNDANATGDWYADSDLNASIMHLIKRLGSKEDCPWLAKTVFVVSAVSQVSNSATINSSELDELVQSFLSSYSGKSINDAKTLVTPLPPHFTYPLIRSVLVLSNIPTFLSSSSSTEVRILPHGKRGTLPNLDLVFATVLSFQSRDKTGYQSNSMFHGDSDFRVHPFPEVETGAVNIMHHLWDILSGDFIEKGVGMKEGTIKKAFIQYAKDMGGLLGFMGASMLGQAGPHYPALERGIDSLTIELRIPPKPVKNVASSTTLIHAHMADTARVVEHLLRAISNLHERLHHSVAQYTLPSMTKFVSHGEYIFPAILTTLPMVIRATMLALRDIRRFRFVFVGMVVGAVSLMTGFIYIWSYYQDKENKPKTGNSVNWNDLSVYFASHAIVITISRRTSRAELSKWLEHSPADGTTITMDEHHKSLRFIACLCAIYLHAPLLLANYSLGLPSSAFWCPLLAIFMFLPSDRLKHRIWMRLILSFAMLALLIVTCPPIFVVPKIFGMNTTYINTVYTPLHLLLSVLCFGLITL